VRGVHRLTMTTTPMLEGIPAAQPEPRQSIPTCTRCGRTLRNPVEIDGRSYGSTCARTLFGKRSIAGNTASDRTPVVRDALTLPLFEVVA